MKASQVLVRVLSDASAAALETAVNAFLAALTEETLIRTHFSVDAGTFSAMIVYTK